MERRNVVKGALLGSITAIAMPQQWSKPIIDAVILPAHAQTSSSCSGFTESAVNEPLDMSVTATQVSGPITVARNGNTFAGTDTAIVGTCQGGNDQTIQVSLSGTIDSANNSMSGDITIILSCGNDLISDQVSTFILNQSPSSASDEGDYSGTLTGTLRRCNDF